MRGVGMTEWIVGVQYRAPEASARIVKLTHNTGRDGH
jgi:hypothetical protein